MLSDQNVTSLITISSAEHTEEASLEPSTAAINSNRGMLTAFNGATLDFEVTKRTELVWSS